MLVNGISIPLLKVTKYMIMTAIIYNKHTIESCPNSSNGGGQLPDALLFT